MKNFFFLVCNVKMKQCAELEKRPVCPLHHSALLCLFMSCFSSCLHLSVHLDSSSYWWCGTLSSICCPWLCCSCWPGTMSSSLQERTADRETWWVNLRSRFSGVSALCRHRLVPLIIVKKNIYIIKRKVHYKL